MSVRTLADTQIIELIRERFDEILRPSITSPGREGNILQYPANGLSDGAAFRGTLLECIESLYSELRVRLSVSARINQLPDDILIRIMSLLSFPEVVTATHVCHRWRKVGVETAALWTRPTITDSLDEPDVLFARAKAASIDLEITVSRTTRRPSRDPELLVAHHMGKVRSLTIISEPEPRDGHYDSTESQDQGDPPTPPALFPAPRLETLRIDREGRDRAEERSIPFDCSSLQEAYLICGVSNVGFLNTCSRLRVLALHVTSTVSAADVLRIIRANAALRTLELHIPHRWDVDGSSAHNTGVPIACQLEHLRVHRVFASPLSGPSSSVILALVRQFDYAHIREVEVPCRAGSGDAAEDTLSGALLENLQEVTAIALGADAKSLRLQDARGYMRSFVTMPARGPVRLALPYLRHVRSLDARLSQWSELATLDVAEFPALEGLTLRGELTDFARAATGNGAASACPALRTLTLMEWLDELYRPLDEEKLDFLAVALAFRRDRLRLCRPLQLLTIIRCAFGNRRFTDQALHFDAPLPETVLLTSAMFDTSKLQNEESGGYCSYVPPPLPLTGRLPLPVI
ncbi:hypothetical protein AURDEDRAFT_187784 [Auricularia subglabra TFB-10046 SS5]|nr:hypothetical protein AURDEDRAFT_187784 [Auricularia subglabra TFB-10046 SS5]